MARSDEILDFWLSLDQDAYFSVNPDLDEKIRQRFMGDYETARRGGYMSWQASPRQTLALIVLLDQFPRNMFRGQAQAFATDGEALEVARTAVSREDDMKLALALRRWVYLPFMHSESLDDQLTCIRLCQRSGLEDTAKWARVHADVIEKFGRFPHRNAVLGRTSTDEEVAFLEAGGFSA